MTLHFEDRIANLSPEKLALLNQHLQRQVLQTAPKNSLMPLRDPNQPARLSFSQQRLWFLQQLEPSNNAYNEPSAWRLSGNLNVVALEQSLREILRRHEVMRTLIVTQDGEPVQTVVPAVLSLPVVDLSSISDLHREANLHKKMYEVIHRSFDLAQEIPIRYALYRLDESTHVLLSVRHHISSDGWSSGVFYRELSVLYNAFAAGQPSPLPDLPIQYADFAAWQRQVLHGEKLATHLNYWQNQLSGLPELLNLPHDFARPDNQNAPSAEKSIVLSAELVEALKDLSRQSDATLFMTLLAAFQVLLARYTNQTDIAVGTPTANRQRVEMEGLIGMFVNTLVMRNDLSGNPTFRQLLARVRERALSAYEHQDLPFEKLVEVLNPVRSLNHNPLVQVMFSVQNTPSYSTQLTGLNMTQMNIGFEAAKFDLSLTFSQIHNTLSGRLIYNAALFDVDTIDRLLGHFVHLIKGIVANPDRPIMQVPLLSEAEQQRQLVTWNLTAQDYPNNQSLHRLFEAQVARTPNEIAVVLDTEEGLSVGIQNPQNTLTYQQLNQQANQLAHYLRSVGVAADTLVGIFLERSREMIVAVLGILKAGGAYVPIDPTNPRERIGGMLVDADISLVLTSANLVSKLPSTVNNTFALDTNWQRLGQLPSENLTFETRPNQLAYVLFTSGSTGRPKGVMVEHRQIVNYIYAILATCVPAGSSCAMVQPLSVDSCLTMLFPPLLTGGVLHLISKNRVFDAHALAAYFQTHPIDCLKIAPSHLAVLQLEVPPEQLMPRQRLIIGGEASQLTWVQQLQHLKPDCQIFNHYGPTEATVGVLTYAVSTVQPNFVTLNTPLGHPIANTQIYILDAHRQCVPVRVTGELYIGGDNVARGYLNRPELTNERFIENPFGAGRLYKTGDLARYLPNGTVEFLGRDDFQVKIRGFRVELDEIETVLLQHPSVLQCAVIVKKEFDEKLVAYVVIKHAQPLIVEMLRHQLQQKLPAYMLPSAIIQLDALPSTPHGKVDRKALALRDVSLETLESYVAPQTQTERLIAQLWSEILNIEKVGRNDHFFDLGGHSLRAIQIISRLNQHFRVSIPLRDIFHIPRLHMFAQHIDDVCANTEMEKMLSILNEVEAL